MTDDTERRLLEAIRVNCEDEEARTVYADWLDQRGDPRGEYLRLEAQLRRIPQRLALLTGVIDPAWIALVSRFYDVLVGDPGVDKISVIKAIREVTGFGLRDAKEACEGASNQRPYMLLEKVEREEAEAIAARFADSTANVQIVPHGMKSLLRFRSLI